MAKIRIKRKTVDKMNSRARFRYWQAQTHKHLRRPCDIKGHPLHVGDIVRVVACQRKSNRLRKMTIKEFYSDVDNGLILTEYIENHRSWNGFDVVWEASPGLLAKALLG